MAGASSIRKDILNVPNALTLLRIFLIPLVMYLIWKGDPGSCMWAALAFTAAAITDFLDGYIARKANLVSMTGKFLDPLADKLIVMASLVMLAEVGRLPGWVVVLIVAREISITGLRALASTEGIIITSREGGKFKTAFQLVGLIALIIHFDYLIDWWLFSSQIDFNKVGIYLLGVSVFFSVWSGLEYFVGFLKGVGQMGDENTAS